MNRIMIYIGAALLILWGIWYLYCTQRIINGFGKLSPDNKKILTLGLITKGLFFIFLGIFTVFSVIYGFYYLSYIQLRMVVVMLIILAGLSLMTGINTKKYHMKFCPVVELMAAAMIFVGTIIPV
jgi:hypothetical protein